MIFHYDPILGLQYFTCLEEVLETPLTNVPQDLEIKEFMELMYNYEIIMTDSAELSNTYTRLDYIYSNF